MTGVQTCALPISREAIRRYLVTSVDEARRQSLLASQVAADEFVIVWFDYSNNKSMPIPASVRALLQGKAAVN